MSLWGCIGVRVAKIGFCFAGIAAFTACTVATDGLYNGDSVASPDAMASDTSHAAGSGGSAVPGGAGGHLSGGADASPNEGGAGGAGSGHDAGSRAPDAADAGATLDAGGAGGMDGEGDAGEGGGDGAGGMGGMAPVLGPNLLKNPGFEDGLVHWSSPKGRGGLIEPGRLDALALREPDPMGWWQQNVGRFQKGSSYVLSGWARGSAGGCRIGIKGGVTGGELRRDSESFGLDWQTRSLTVTLPEDLRWLQVFLWNGGGADCEYDDLAIRPVTE
jgi:hypothetical protein